MPTELDVTQPSDLSKISSIIMSNIEGEITYLKNDFYNLYHSPWTLDFYIRFFDCFVSNIKYLFGITQERPSLFFYYEKVSLSHNLLVHRKESEYQCYAIDKEPLGSGAFGQVSSVVKLIIYSLNWLKIIKEIAIDRIVKEINTDGSLLEDTAIENEKNHTTEIWPETVYLHKKNDPPVQLKDGTPKTDTHWFITRRLKGKKLSDFSPSEISIQNKLKIALSLMKELIQLHDSKELGGEHIHNDIKPDNIIVDEETYEAHFCDFGGASRQSELMLTATPIYVKTRNQDGFAKPEGDIHTLGITLFQLFIPQTKSHGSPWEAMPKGKVSKLEKDWDCEFNLTKVKVTSSSLGKKMHGIFNKKVEIVSTDELKGLTKKQSRQLFSTLKMMRKNTVKKPLQFFLSEMQDLYDQISEQIIRCDI